MSPADAPAAPRDPAADRALADAARRVNRAIRVTAAAGDVRARAVALLTEAAALLETDEHEGPHCQVGFGAGFFDGGASPAQFFPYSPVCGPLNPLSPPVELTVTDDRHVTGRVVLHEGYNGPPWNLAHGGVIAQIFDELLGVAGIVAAGGGFTGRLTVHYRRPTPILEELALAARVERIEGRKLIATGEIRHGDTVTAEAEGVFIQVAGPLRDADDAPDDAPVPPGGG